MYEWPYILATEEITPLFREDEEHDEDEVSPSKAFSTFAISEGDRQCGKVVNGETKTHALDNEHGLEPKPNFLREGSEGWDMIIWKRMSARVSSLRTTSKLTWLTFFHRWHLLHHHIL